MVMEKFHCISVEVRNIHFLLEDIVYIKIEHGYEQCNAASEKQKHLSNLLSIVQKRAAEYEQCKSESKSDLSVTSNTPKNASTTTTASTLIDTNNTITKNNTNLSNKNTKPKIKKALPDYNITNDAALPLLDINLKSTIEPRPYQVEALNAITYSNPDASDNNDKISKSARSGIIVLPCGAGKTLTSILVASAIKKSVLVVCSTIIAAEQFQKEFLHFTTLMATRMGMFAGSKKWPFNGPSGVLFTTYTMLVDSKNRTQDSKRMAQFIDKTDWGLIILDEVHCGPAANFSKAILKIKAKVRLGLTATMLREDEKIGDLDHIVGPILYQAKWKELADRGYIAKVICTQVECQLSASFRQSYIDLSNNAISASNNSNNSDTSYLGQKHHIKSLLSILNPKKMQICQRLIQYHEAKGDKVLVYCDHIEALKLYADTIKRPYIYGGTPTAEAQELLERFQIDASVESVANNSSPSSSLTCLDLPAATVLIQVSSHFGSRRQEAQRLGRVLRAKKRNEKGFYSRFYTLVTNDTHEVTFSERRRQFLEEECGYGYQIWNIGDELQHEKEKIKMEQDDDTKNIDDDMYLGNGWVVHADPSATTPLDDEIKTDPLSCHIDTKDERPYHTPKEEEDLLKYILNLKNIQVEDEDSDESTTTSTSKTTSSSVKRRRITK
ncbi:unnamed protein product [Cunninghamella blakesleeana]